MANPDSSEAGELPRKGMRLVLGVLAAVMAVGGLLALGMRLRRRYR